MLLATLVQAVPAAQTSGRLDLEIGGLAFDSRRVTRGDLFVAVPSIGGGPESGGYRHIDEARCRGAAAIVSEAPIEERGITAIRVGDARAALADLSSTYFGHPSRSMRLYAVTGTDGKTTTTYLLEQVLSAAGRETGLMGTVETKIGPHRERNLDRMTTPESLDVQALLASMRHAGVTDVALEASSHALALDRLRGCAVHACAVTSITADHLEFHGSWDEYFASKRRLFTDLAPGRPAVLNVNDPCFDSLRAAVSGDIITYGLGQPADLRADDIAPLGAGSEFVMHYAGEKIPTAVGLPGSFNVSNALAAAGLALFAGIPLIEIARALTEASPPLGRMQRVDLGQPFEIIVDYAHTRNAFELVLRTLRERARGRVIAVFGATGNRDRGKRPHLARLAHQFADFSYITNEDPYEEDPLTIINEVASGMPRGTEGVKFVRQPDRDLAIQGAISCARKGDIVVILGKGHEQSIVEHGAKLPWNDIDAVHRALRARA